MLTRTAGALVDVCVKKQHLFNNGYPSPIVS